LEQQSDCIILCLSSLLLSEFSCQGDSPIPVVYSPEMDLISQPRSYLDRVRCLQSNRYLGRRLKVDHRLRNGPIKWLYCFSKPPSHPPLMIASPATKIPGISHVLISSIKSSQACPLNTSGRGVSVRRFTLCIFWGRTNIHLPPGRPCLQ
jgi:hypothetical protein